MREFYDFVIIGSGFGGAVTAARLSQAGRSVCILERGRRWDKREFPRSISQTKRSLWKDKESQGFLEYKVFGRMDVIQGVGVGGGSLHYFNVQKRVPADIFTRPEWPRAMGRELLDPYYDLIHDMLDSRPLTPPRGYALPPRTTAFMEAARLAGREPELVPIAVHTGEPRNNPHGGVAQEACDYSGDCLIGCRLHAKNTLDLNYIPLAERNGAEVYPLHEVDRIEPLGSAYGGGYRIVFDRHDPSDPSKSEQGEVLAKKVIVAAGTLGSTQILLRSRDLHKTLPRLPRTLGQRFSGNGDMLFGGALNANRVVDPGQGPSITAGATFTRNGSPHRIFIEDLGFPTAFMWLLEGTLPSSSRTLGLLKAVRTYASAALGFRGRGQSRIGFAGEQLFAGERTNHFLPFLGMGTDAGDGRLFLGSDGRIDLEWDPAASMEMFDEMEQGMRELSDALGGDYFRSFLWDWPLKRLLTAHPLGGCVMSDAPEDGVCNDRGEVWGHPDLYVADGSMVPGPLAVNPSMTIGALAERVAYHLIHGRELRAGGPTPTNS